MMSSGPSSIVRGRREGWRTTCWRCASPSSARRWFPEKISSSTSSGPMPGPLRRGVVPQQAGFETLLAFAADDDQVGSAADRAASRGPSPVVEAAEHLWDDETLDSPKLSMKVSPVLAEDRHHRIGHRADDARRPDTGRETPSSWGAGK